ncbi:hypothetical protein QWA68_016521 [Fusarium oxysporum]|nr:hypothetical protein QWA68_016521 [Fusarium oxysporum]
MPCTRPILTIRPLQSKLRSDNPRVSEVADQRIFAVGVYGRGPRDPKAFYELNRKLELRSAELLVAKLLYSRTYYTEDEFQLIYDQKIYLEMRKKCKAKGLPPAEAIWDKAIRNKEYLLKK